MISRDLNCIFVHIPKTGGTSIEDVIWTGERTEADLWMGIVAPLRNKYQTGGLQHLLARQIRHEVGDDLFSRCFRFSFVRNPWDKAVSQFSHMQERPELRAFIGMKEDDSFARYLSLIREKQHVQWMAQSDFLLDEYATNIVEFIGRFENLADDAQKVFAKLGLICDRLPHRLPSKHGRYVNYYDGDTKQTIYRLYERDIDMFKYAFAPAV